ILFVHGALEHESAALVRAMPELTVQAIRGGRPERIDPEQLAFLDEHPGVRAHAPRIWGYLYVPSLGANVSVIGVGPASLAGVAPILDGAPPAEEGEAVVGDAFARSLGLRPGDSI